MILFSDYLFTFYNGSYNFCSILLDYLCRSLNLRLNFGFSYSSWICGNELLGLGLTYFFDYILKGYF